MPRINNYIVSVVVHEREDAVHRRAWDLGELDVHRLQGRPATSLIFILLAIADSSCRPESLNRSSIYSPTLAGVWVWTLQQPAEMSASVPVKLRSVGYKPMLGWRPFTTVCIVDVREGARGLKAFSFVPPGRQRLDLIGMGEEHLRRALPVLVSKEARSKFIRLAAFRKKKTWIFARIGILISFWKNIRGTAQSIP
jgi:hypothetical protein